MDVMTKVEWENWYIGEYIPEQLEGTQGIYYEDIKGKKTMDCDTRMEANLRKNF